MGPPHVPSAQVAINASHVEVLTADVPMLVTRYCTESGGAATEFFPGCMEFGGRFPGVDYASNREVKAGEEAKHAETISRRDRRRGRDFLLITDLGSSVNSA
jgi:hypothetical protein